MQCPARSTWPSKMKKSDITGMACGKPNGIGFTMSAIILSNKGSKTQKKKGTMLYIYTDNSVVSRFLEASQTSLELAQVHGLIPLHSEAL